MIINLNKSVLLKEFAELSVTGVEVTDKNYRVEVAFSKEALIGFATNLIWMYEDINENKKFHIHIDPFGRKNIPGNQALGFFMTPSSPSLVVVLNDVMESDCYDRKLENYKEIYIRNEIKKSIEIKEPACDESIEEYELGYNNIADVAIYNEENINITQNYMQVVFKLNYIGLKDFATMLLILANNYKTGNKYHLANINQKNFKYNMGIMLNGNSCEMTLKCKDLGCVYDYEPEFGYHN